jgi:hypothetical protein
MTSHLTIEIFCGKNILKDTNEFQFEGLGMKILILNFFAYQ